MSIMNYGCIGGGLLGLTGLGIWRCIWARHSVGMRYLSSSTAMEL